MSLYAKFRKKLGGFQLEVDLSSESGTLGLLGASGCGKSLTLKCIAGIMRPDHGIIKVNDEVLFDSRRGIDLCPQKRRIGLMFQNYALFPNMTLKNNILSVLRYSSRVSDPGERLDGLLESLYLKGLEEHYPCQLSGGQQQRVALARILASEPKLIMLDEPLSALDSYLRWQVERELLDALGSFSGTTLYVSHNREEIRRMCERICVINNGRTEKVRTAEELFEAPSSLAAALLSGYRNYSRALRIDDKRIMALDWKAELNCKKADEGTRYIGVRAHNVTLCDMNSDNAIKCRVVNVDRDVFFISATLLPLDGDKKEESSYIKMELPHSYSGDLRVDNIVSIRMSEEDIIPLTA